MPDIVQLRGGNETENNNFTGAEREVTVDTTSNTLRVHDGNTAGGHSLATTDYVDDTVADSASATIQDHGTITSNTTFNRNNGEYHIATVNANLTLSLMGFNSGVADFVTVELAVTGSHTISWDSAVVWQGDSPPPLASNTSTLINFVSTDGGLTIIGSYSMARSIS